MSFMLQDVLVLHVAGALLDMGGHEDMSHEFGDYQRAGAAAAAATDDELFSEFGSTETGSMIAQGRDALVLSQISYKQPHERDFTGEGLRRNFRFFPDRDVRGDTTWFFAEEHVEGAREEENKSPIWLVYRGTKPDAWRDWLKDAKIGALYPDEQVVLLRSGLSSTRAASEKTYLGLGNVPGGWEYIEGKAHSPRSRTTQHLVAHRGFAFHALGMDNVVWDGAIKVQPHMDGRPLDFISPGTGPASPFGKILMEDVLPKVQSGQRKLIITGHSLGGAAARVMASWLLRDGFILPNALRETDVQVITFGAPPVFFRHPVVWNPFHSQDGEDFIGAFEHTNSKSARSLSELDVVDDITKAYLEAPVSTGLTHRNHCAFINGEDIVPRAQKELFLPDDVRKYMAGAVDTISVGAKWGSFIPLITGGGLVSTGVISALHLLDRVSPVSVQVANNLVHPPHVQWVHLQAERIAEWTADASVDFTQGYSKVERFLMQDGATTFWDRWTAAARKTIAKVPGGGGFLSFIRFPLLASDKSEPEISFGAHHMIGDPEITTGGIRGYAWAMKRFFLNRAPLRGDASEDDGTLVEPIALHPH